MFDAQVLFLLFPVIFPLQRFSSLLLALLEAFALSASLGAVSTAPAGPG